VKEYVKNCVKKRIKYLWKFKNTLCVWAEYGIALMEERDGKQFNDFKGQAENRLMKRC
jgi:hypothetical protein